MKFVQLAKSLQSGAPAPVYLIEGEEAYFRDHAVSQIRAACAITQPALNEMRLEGETLKGEKLASLPAELSTLPLFDERRLVRVCEFYPSEREWERALADYVARPAPTTVLLIVNAGRKAGAADLRRKAGVTYVDCSRESEEMLSQWLFRLMKKQGIAADSDACSLMVRYCAQDAARMKLETEKLACLLGEGERLTRETVEEHVAKDVEYKVYELTQAASRGNYAAFSQILSDLMKKGFDENAALAALTAHYRTLLEVAASRKSDAETARLLGIKPFAVQKNREIVRRLGEERVRELYLALYGLSCEMKSGLCTKTGAMTAAVAKIFFG